MYASSGWSEFEQRIQRTDAAATKSDYRFKIGDYASMGAG